MATTLWGWLGVAICLVFVAWKFSSVRDNEVPLMTFDRSHYLNLTDLHEPTSREEIIDLIRNVNNEQGKLRVLGSGHSLLPIAVSEGVTLSLRKFRGLVSFD